VRANVLHDIKRPTIQDVIRKNVEPGSALYTDTLASYAGLRADYLHEFIDHAECYVKGNVHTNGLENFWSLFKRCIKGTHVSIEPFHLVRYLDAECFRFNNRKLTDGERFLLALRGAHGKRMTYAELTSATEFLPASRDNDAGNAVLAN